MVKHALTTTKNTNEKNENKKRKNEDFREEFLNGDKDSVFWRKSPFSGHGSDIRCYLTHPTNTLTTSANKKDTLNL